VKRSSLRKLQFIALVKQTA